MQGCILESRFRESFQRQRIQEKESVNPLTYERNKFCKTHFQLTYPRQKSFQMPGLRSDYLPQLGQFSPKYILYDMHHICRDERNRLYDVHTSHIPYSVYHHHDSNDTGLHIPSVLSGSRFPAVVNSLMSPIGSLGLLICIPIHAQ